jgi:mRNA interferase HigB
VRVVGRERLERFISIHSDAASAVEAWLREARSATWRTPADIKARYATASFLANNRVIFNIRGNIYRLDTQIAYLTQIVVIKRIGTHAEYDRWEWPK